MLFFKSLIKLNGLTIALLFLGLQGPLQAGTYRAITIDDRPIGNTVDHIYWIRTVDDNQQEYTDHLTHVFLVKQEIVTGEVVAHWLLRRLDWSTRKIEGEGQDETQHLSVQEPPETEHEGKRAGAPADATLYRNAFDILRSERATHISSMEISAANSELERWDVSSEDGLSFTHLGGELDADGEPPMDIRLSAAEIERQLSASVRPTIEEMKNFSTDHPLSIIPQTSFSGDISACVVDNTMLVVSKSLKQYLQISCESPDLIHWWKFWLVLD